MKRQVIALTLVGMTLFALPAFAKDNNNNGEGHGFKLGNLFHFGKKHSDQFAVTGVIKSIGSGTIVITSTSTYNVPNVLNGDATIKTDANTKVTSTSDKKKEHADTIVTTPAFTLASLVVGQKITATGTVTGTDALAKNIQIVNTGKIVGKVTAKTATSVTITNGVTTEVKTITTDADTKVMINGETKAIADIQVGDSGWVKFKTVGTNLVAKFINLFR